MLKITLLLSIAALAVSILALTTARNQGAEVDHKARRVANEAKAKADKCLSGLATASANFRMIEAGQLPKAGR